LDGVPWETSLVDGEILWEILRALTRYSANDLEFPVNNPPLFTGCSRNCAAAGLTGSAIAAAFPRYAICSGLGIQLPVCFILGSMGPWLV